MSVTETTGRSAAGVTFGGGLLTAQGLTHSFGGNLVLDDVELCVSAGECVVLCGPNGSGKSTLLNILGGYIEPEGGRLQIRGTDALHIFDFPQQWWQVWRQGYEPEKAAELGVVKTWQDLRLFQTQSLRDNIRVSSPETVGEGPVAALLRRRATVTSVQESSSAADAVLRDLGLGSREHSSGDMISLGQARRVAIARAAATNARLMLLDEPLSGLDEAGVRQVLDLLSSLREDRDMALLVVEHPGSITPLLQMADRTWRLNDGKLTVKEGPVSSGVARPPIAANTPADHSAEDGGNPGQAEVNCESDSSSVDTAQLVRTSSLPTDVATECVFEIDELEVYRNRRRVIGASDAEGSSSGFSLRIHRGEMVILEAPNGWGKTTLVDAIAGVEPVESGRIRLAGQDITDWPSFRRSRGGLCVVRARDNVFEDLTVREMLLLSRVDDIPPALDGFADKQCSLLSGGERQILALLSALSGSVERTVVILDEPFSGLDDEALSVVFDHINAIRSDVGMLLCLPVVSEHIDSFIEGGRLKCVSV